MGIETNQASDQSPAPEEVRASNFSGADLGARGAVTGSFDFASLAARFGTQRADPNVEPYLETIKKFVTEAFSGNGVSIVRAKTLTGGYAVKYEAPDGTVNMFILLFVTTGDQISTQYLPASYKLQALRKEFSDDYAGQQFRITDARVIISNYEPEMARAEKMADTIVRTFNAVCVNELKNAKVTAVATNEFVVDWRLAEARATEDQLSPHGIRPRIDVGLTVKAKIPNALGREFREFGDDYRLFGMIGGYVEIRNKEPVQVGTERHMLYRPVFTITALHAVIPLEGVAAILLAALAPTIYNSLFWATQWKQLNDGDANPGMLELDPANSGRPYVLKDQEALKEFVETYFAKPEIAFQFQDGRDAIPGFWKLGSTDSQFKGHFVDRLTNFFDTPAENGANFELSRNIETRYDGAYGDPKGNLHDSRDIDYLYIAAKTGAGSIDSEMRRVLLGNGENPTERARITAQVTGSFVPLYLDTTSLINPDFIKWIAEKAANRNLVIIDPNQQMETRSLGSFTDGFGSSAGIGSIVRHGVTARGLNLGSIWNTTF